MKKSILFTGLIILALALGFPPSTAQAQSVCGPVVSAGPQCLSDADCLNAPNAPCPSCFTCQNGECLPDNTLCDDGTMCTTGICNDSPNLGPLGCIYSSDALGPNGLPDLDIECYMCEPTANGVTVDNGICDPGAGETCDNSVDCRTDPAQGCITPPADPGGLCDSPEFAAVICTDNDRCTLDTCGFPNDVPTCMNTPITTCEADADGCCPEGCTGPIPGDPNGCRDVTGAPIPGCDADCWAPQSCGDGQVQPPETCDDAANVGDAGLAPDGSAITDEQCRDPGTAGECTACGDGIVQAAAGEECDGADATACGPEGICNAPGTLGECTCAALPPPPVTNICVTGSGNPFDTIRTNCGNCSLNLGATSQGPLKDNLGWILLAMGAAGAMVFRFRRA